MKLHIQDATFRLVCDACGMQSTPYRYADPAFGPVGSRFGWALLEWDCSSSQHTQEVSVGNERGLLRGGLSLAFCAPCSAKVETALERLIKPTRRRIDKKRRSR